MDLQRLRVVVPALQLFEKAFGRSLGSEGRHHEAGNNKGNGSHYILDVRTARSVYESHQPEAGTRAKFILFVF